MPSGDILACLQRSCALLCLSGLASFAAAAAPDPALLGCWRAARIVLHTPDGSRAEDTSGRCSLRFKEESFESTCKTSTGVATTTYRYQVVRPQVYAATMAGSTFKTEMVGSTREYEYRVEGDQLRTVTVPAPLAFAAAATAGARKVETDSTRIPCP